MSINKQSKLGSTTGSFINHMMMNNNTVPVVGKGATILSWADRSAYEVIEVTKGGKCAIIQRYAPKRIDGLGMSECQSYEYKDFTEEKQKIVFKWGSWKIERDVVRFDKKWLAEHEERFGEYAQCTKSLTPEQKLAIYKGDVYPQGIVEGIAHKAKEYANVNIIFGMKEEYYDFSF